MRIKYEVQRDKPEYSVKRGRILAKVSFTVPQTALRKPIGPRGDTHKGSDGVLCDLTINSNTESWFNAPSNFHTLPRDMKNTEGMWWISNCVLILSLLDISTAAKDIL
jgi:hypothetical protein